MNFIKSKFLRTVTSMLLIVAMAVGLAAGMEKKADAASITITYNLTSGQVSPYDSSKTVKKPYTAGWITLEKSSYYYPGKSIIGWATKSGGSKVYDPGQRVQITSSITLYAIWGNPNTCYHSKYTQQIIVQTTCTRDGKAKCVCSSCGKTWEKTLTAPGHKYGSIKTTDATCTKAGEKYKICSACGVKQTVETIPSKGGHKYTLVESTDASCEKMGKVHQRCKVCGDNYVTLTPATGHNWKVIEYRGESKHLRKCDKCNKQEEVSHTLGTISINGRHRTGCTAEACYGKVLPTQYVQESLCRDHVTAWHYYVDKTTFASSGQNMYLREGICANCGSGIIEFGYSGFQSTSSEGLKFSQAIETIVAAAKFAITVKLIKVNAAVEVVRKIHTGIGLLYKISNGVEKIKEAHCDGNQAYESKLQTSITTIKNLQYMDPSDNSYKQELISAKNYFNNTKNMKSIYAYNYSD